MAQVARRLKQPSGLTTTERDTLGKLESELEQSATAMWVNLAVIRDQKLYRESDKSFAAYCKRRWGISKSRAYQLIEGAEVIADVSTIVDAAPPRREAQVRELAKAPKEKRAKAWSKATADAKKKNGTPQPTAVEVRRAVAEIVDPPKETPTAREPWAMTNDAVDSAVDQLKSAAGTMRGGFGITGQDITNKYAKRFSWTGTVGAVNQIIRTLNDGRIVGEDAKGPITAYDAKKHDALKGDK